MVIWVCESRKVVETQTLKQGFREKDKAIVVI